MRPVCTASRARSLVKEDGFSLIEMVVAMTMLAGVFTAGAHLLASSLKATIFARHNGQAVELISESIESLRAEDYAAVALVPSDLAGDAAITGPANAPVFDPDGAGPLAPEPVVTATTGVVSPHVTTVTRNSQRYTLRTYVTRPTDTQVASAAYKRVTVVATWAVGTQEHDRQASTLLALTRRGLPLPNFKLSGGLQSPVTVNAGADLVLPYSLINRGARDSFELAISTTPALGSTIQLLKDQGSLGAREAGDLPLGDADGDASPDTGLVETDATVPMLGVASLPITTSAGTYSVRLTATSVAQPDAAGAVRTHDYTVVVVNQSSCAGCTYQALYLRNQWPVCATAPCATTMRTDMPMRTEVPTATSLPNFDTDIDVVAGRRLAGALVTPAATAAGGTTVANWRYQAPSNMTLNGNVLINVHASAPSAAVPVGIGAYVRRSTGGSSWELVGSGTAFVPPGSTVSIVQILVPVNTSITKNRYLEVKLVVNAASLTNLELAYDTAAYPAAAMLPVVLP